jgi:hypothetical protein
MSLTTFTSGTKAKASEVNANFEYLETDITTKNNNLNNISIPVGSIIPWHKSIKSGASYSDATEYTTQGNPGILKTYETNLFVTAGITSGDALVWNVNIRRDNETGGAPYTVYATIYYNSVSNTLDGNQVQIGQVSTSSESWTLFQINLVKDSWASGGYIIITGHPGSTSGSQQFGTKISGQIFSNNFANLSTNWVECNGQVLSDAESLLNGLTIPNLNGDNRTLRGNATSGGTGGAETHSHTASSVRGDGGFTFYTANNVTGTSSSWPPYMNVVWIMRVK